MQLGKPQDWLTYSIIGVLAVVFPIVTFCLWTCFKKSRTKFKKNSHPGHRPYTGLYEKLSQTVTENSKEEINSKGLRKEMVNDRKKKRSSKTKGAAKKFDALFKCTPSKNQSSDEADSIKNGKTSCSEKKLDHTTKKKGSKKDKKSNKMKRSIKGKNEMPVGEWKGEGATFLPEDELLKPGTVQARTDVRKRTDKEWFLPHNTRKSQDVEKKTSSSGKRFENKETREYLMQRKEESKDIPVSDLSLFSGPSKVDEFRMAPYDNHREYNSSYSDIDGYEGTRTINETKGNRLFDTEREHLDSVAKQSFFIETRSDATGRCGYQEMPKEKSLWLPEYGGETHQHHQLKESRELQQEDKLVMLTSNLQSFAKKDRHFKEMKEPSCHDRRNCNSVGPATLITDYATKEWKGETVMADKIRRGYARVRVDTGLECIQLIRGDNYCALRAVLFKSLASGINILANFDQTKSIKELSMLMDSQFCWMESWNFANRLRLEDLAVKDMIEECLDCLEKVVKRCIDCEQDSRRCEMVLNIMNSGEEEVKLFEALKFLMLFKSQEYFNKMQNNEEVNILAFLLFARNTSTSPEYFMKNHLNQIGDSCGLDQLEMILLGHTLNLVIKVMRLHRVDDDDFTVNFPDDLENPCDFVTLVAEDDRHYNVLTETP